LNKNNLLLFGLSLVLLSVNIFSFDSIKQEYELNINAGSTETNEIDVDIKLEADKFISNFYSNFRLRVLADKDDFSAKLDRAYLSYNKNKILLTAGRQRIYWGISSIFNYTDIFNRIDVADPSKDMTGVDAVKLLYNHTYFSRVEIANEFKSGKDSFAARYTFVKHSFEYMFNYLNYENRTKNEDYIFEFKGDIIVGIWGQYIRKVNPLESNIFVFGSDYSFLIKDNILYLITEISINNRLKQNLYYAGVSYEINQFTIFNLNYTDSNSGQLFFQTGLDYFIDDYKKICFYYRKLFMDNPALFPELSSGYEFTLTLNLTI
jgi:hypothetical protein